MKFSPFLPHNTSGSGALDPEQRNITSSEIRKASVRTALDIFEKPSREEPGSSKKIIRKS
jgi:hypothetical protein